MKRSKYSESQIVFAIKQVETGTGLQEVCRKMGISEATFYNWKKKYGGLGVSELRRLKNLKEENLQLKKLVADLSLDKQILQDVLKKKFRGRPESAGWSITSGWSTTAPSSVAANSYCCTRAFFLLQVQWAQR